MSAYRIAPGGVITEHEIPLEGLDIGDGVMLLDGEENRYWQAWTLARVTEIVGRMAPWVTAWCGPHVDSDGGSWTGMCFDRGRSIAIRTGCAPQTSVATAYHECAHALDVYLLPHAQAALDDATGGLGWPGVYLAKVSERRARLVEHACMSLDHGAMLHVHPGSATEIVWQMYTGEVARQRDAAIAEAEAARVAASRPTLFRRAKEMIHG